tara:strand:+ start:1374 stop:1583 length:210 start_codon:yes stop_codon:yes gene_type:complete
MGGHTISSALFAFVAEFHLLFPSGGYSRPPLGFMPCDGTNLSHSLNPSTYYFLHGIAYQHCSRIFSGRI